jgi:hypothetical protein
MDPYCHRQSVFQSAVLRARDIQVQTPELIELIIMLRTQLLLGDRMPNSYLRKWTERPATIVSFG